MISCYLDWSRKEKIQITNNRKEGGTNTTDTIDTATIGREYYEQFYINKLNNLDKMVQLPKWLKGKIDKRNRSVSTKEIKYMVKAIRKSFHRENSRDT